MTPLVWATLALCAVAALLIVGIPYWMTFMRPNHRPDHTEAHTYLDAKAGRADGVVPDQPAPEERHPSVGTAPIGRPRGEEEASRLARVA